MSRQIMADDRVEMQDSMGTVKVPADALYQAQTQRALDNFRISSLRLPTSLIQALARIKQACALVNHDLDKLSAEQCKAIASAAAAIIDGEHADQFDIDVFQTGSGTSTNMNLNEVIATLASRDGINLHPNDHVNMGQSSNDVFPSAIHIAAAIALHEQLLPALRDLQDSLQARSIEFAATVKNGRTHLMDAVPISLGQEISAWESMLKNDCYRLQTSLTRVQQLAIGGTAVGTGINTTADFGDRVCAHLTQATGIRFTPMQNLFEGLSSQNTALELSGQLRVLASSLGKISNDLRWMNSGPLSGLGEISLQALQPGSSIMPGKVNPVIPEAVLMATAQCIGNDASIGHAAQSGNFQLNVMLPLIAYNLLQSIEILTNASRHLAGAIDGFRVNHETLAAKLALNPVLVTALNPLIGYHKAAEIARIAVAEKRPVIEVAVEMTDLEESRIRELLDPEKLLKNSL